MLSRARLLLIGLLALAPLPAARADTVAVVNGQELSRAEFGRALVSTLGVSAMETFVDWALVAQEAGRRGLAVTEDELAARYELEAELRLRAVVDNARMGPDEFRQAARRQGWDLTDLRRQMEATISPNALRARLLAEKMLEPELRLDEAALRAHYERTRGERRLAAHILVRTRAQADQLRRSLEADPGAWSEAALRYSLDRAGVPYKGRLRPVPVGSPLGRALADVPDGGLTLFEEGGQWHVVKALGTVEAAEGSFEQVADRIRAEMVVLGSDGRYERLLADLNAGAEVVVNLSLDPGEPSPLGRDAAAFVNGQPLALDDLAEVLVQEYGHTMIEPYVERTLILQEAARRGLSVDEREYEARLRLIGAQLFEDQAARRGMSADELAAFLRRSGVEREDLEADLVRQFACPGDVRATLLAEKMVADDVGVSEPEVLAAYREMHGHRIVVKELSADNPIDAEQMYRKLGLGVDMDLVARTEMGGPGLWLYGAPVTTVTPEHAYWRHAQGLAEGQTSGIFKEGGRYRIIRALERSSPSDAPPLESVRESLEQEVRLRKSRARIRALLVKLTAEADVEIKLD